MYTVIHNHSIQCLFFTSQLWREKLKRKAKTSRSKMVSPAVLAMREKFGGKRKTTPSAPQTNKDSPAKRQKVSDYSQRHVSLVYTG